MSTWVTLERPCPGCGAVQKLSIARSLNVSRAPAHREVLLAGELHRQRCTSCQMAFTVDCAFEYLDFERKQLFLVFPLAEERRWAELEGEPQKLWERNLGAAELPVAVRELGQGFHVRAVFGPSALREKVILFEAGLDDAAVEAYKLGWMREAPLARMYPGSRPQLHSRRDEDLLFVATPRGGERQVLAVEIATLRAYPVEDPLVGQLRQGPYVDTGRLLFLPE